MDVIEDINLPPPPSSISNEPVSTANYSAPTMSDVTPVSSHVAPAIGSASGVMSPAKDALPNGHSTLPVDQLTDQLHSTVPVSTLPSQTTVSASSVTTSHVTASTATVTVAMSLSQTYTSASNSLSMPLLLTGSTDITSHTAELSSHTAATSTSPVSSIAPIDVQEKPIVKNGEKIVPKEKVTPLLIPAGWTSDTSQIESLNYDELIIEARSESLVISVQSSVSKISRVERYFKVI